MQCVVIWNNVILYSPCFAHSFIHLVVGLARFSCNTFYARCSKSQLQLIKWQTYLFLKYFFSIFIVVLTDMFLQTLLW